MREAADTRRTADHREYLKWLDDDKETREFTEYWFGEKQRNDLRKIAHGLQCLDRRGGEKKHAALDVLKLALSRIIITKDAGASLARDVSHSRPHKVTESTDYDVFRGFEVSVQQLRKRLASQPPPGRVSVQEGDARALRDIGNRSVDFVLSSPPYLNAIDYMRGHKLSLIWMGYRLAELRTIRASNVGSERGLNPSNYSHEFGPILESMGRIDQLPTRDQKMIARYAEDTYRIMSEMARVLKPDGRVFLVMGNSCLRKVFIRNSDGFIAAGRMVGLKLTRQVERDLPMRKRYLPMPKKKGDPLGNRMRTETILTFKLC